MSLPLLTQGLAIGVLTGILYVLVALGLTLIYGILFFDDTATTEIYSLSPHGAPPICRRARA